MSTKNFRDLIYWQKGMDLVAAIYTLTKKLPKEETYSLSDQMRRAAVSIPSNIAEGCERTTTKDYIKHLNIALGSNAELQTQLEICVRINYLTKEEIKEVYILSREIAKILSAAITSLQKKNAE